MGNRDDFYTAENIIGYTGNLHNNPTVYFANALDPTAKGGTKTPRRRLRRRRRRHAVTAVASAG